MTASPLQVSQLLIAWSNGDQTAFDLMPVVYGDLRRIASPLRAESARREHSSNPALNHEAQLKLWAKMRSGSQYRHACLAVRWSELGSYSNSGAAFIAST